MNDLQKLQKLIIDFRDKRDWRQFHNPKDLAISISLEAGELLEHFQWKNSREVIEHINQSRDNIAEEMADVLIYLLTLSNDIDIDLVKAAQDKLAKNDVKYDINNSKGNHKKYTEFEK